MWTQRNLTFQWKPFSSFRRNSARNTWWILWWTQKKESNGTQHFTETQLLVKTPLILLDWVFSPSFQSLHLDRNTSCQVITMKDGLEVVDYHDQKLLSSMVLKRKPTGTKIKLVQHSRANRKANLFIHEYFIPKTKAIKLILSSSENIWLSGEEQF